MELLKRVAENIAKQLDITTKKSVLILVSREKVDIAEEISKYLDREKVENHSIVLGYEVEKCLSILRDFVQNASIDCRFIFLPGIKHAKLIFETIGRPDIGLKLNQSKFFGDWLLTRDGLIRIFNIDMEELNTFRNLLFKRLNGVNSIHVLSVAGTDLHIRTENWASGFGEISAIPRSKGTYGHIVVDACAYYGRPKSPFILEISNGRVKNLSDLDLNDKQQSWVYRDLTRDENSNVLSEFGVGINTGTQWDSELTESEQSRGTCHFGFGNNIEYGGKNKSSYHFDLVIKDATIEADGQIVCENGIYIIGGKEQ